MCFSVSLPTLVLNLIFPTKFKLRFGNEGQQNLQFPDIHKVIFFSKIKRNPTYPIFVLEKEALKTHIFCLAFNLNPTDAQHYFLLLSIF